MTFKVKNDEFVPVAELTAQMLELRPLPMGRADFEEWSDRVISGACIPGATVESQKFILSDALVRLGPTECNKADAYFIQYLRAYAVKQVGDAMRFEIKTAQQERLRLAQEAAAKQTQEIEDEIAAEEDCLAQADEELADGGLSAT